MVAGARDREVERAEADLAAREATVRRLVDDSTRIAPLVSQNLAPIAQLVAARNAVLAAVGERDAAAAALGLLREGTRPERIAAGRADIDKARAQTAATQAVADALVLISGIDGIVATRSAEPGEVLAAGQSAATLVDPRRPWVRVYLGPQHIPVIHVGDTVEARLDAFPDRRFVGRVTSVATRAEYTPRVALTERERADLLFGVRVDFDDSTGMLKAGLPVTVRFTRRLP
jgi:HlyD family secretion protein